jgi:hypothetical protein
MGKAERAFPPNPTPKSPPKKFARVRDPPASLREVGAWLLLGSYSVYAIVFTLVRTVTRRTRP